jgi:hypothetical protein
MDKEFFWNDDTVKEFCSFAFAPCDPRHWKLDSFISDFKEKWKFDHKPKPEWEVLEMKGPSGARYVNVQSWHLKDFPLYKIHSVKRLSDGEVFTVGDIVGANCRLNMPIKGFKAQTGAEKVLVCFHNATDTYLDYIKHAKEEPVPVSLTPTQLEKLYKILNRE